MNQIEERKSVDLFCDGACSGNPGPGGWGALLRFRDAEKELSGGEAHTTNNRMELMACIAGLEALKSPCQVRVTTDSQYLAKAFKDGWLEKWQKNGWRTSSKEPVKNRELWERLIALAKAHEVSWHWIRGHAGHPENERCDRLAVEARERMARGA
ncbi:MAG TPA: ribonuclease HI [Candidatus Ozemobacteraceae bacterium]|nr:ribonuclease HI [Candidatus Ozemobacteraceae bacterium]